MELNFPFPCCKQILSNDILIFSCVSYVQDNISSILAVIKIPNYNIDDSKLTVVLMSDHCVCARQPIIHSFYR